MNKIENQRYDITIKDVMALDDVIEWVYMVETFNYLSNKIQLDKNSIDDILEDYERIKTSKDSEDEYKINLDVEIACEKLKLIQIENKLLNYESYTNSETDSITISDLACLKEALEEKKLSDYFYLDANMIFINQLNPYHLKEIISAFENHYGEDVYQEPVGIAYYKFQMLYHKARIDEMLYENRII